MKAALKLIISVVLCLGVGYLAGLATTESVSGWYAQIDKPYLTPPNWVFAPVWTTLYFIMGIALGLVWIDETSPFKNAAIGIFFLQLVFNGLWSFLFFGLQSPGWALADIAFLILFLGICCLMFFRVNRLAGWLMVPYLIWVVYAGTLNFTILMMN